MTHEYPSGTTLFACPNDEQAVAAAKGYIEREGYTRENVKIYANEKQVMVVKV